MTIREDFSFHACENRSIFLIPKWWHFSFRKQFIFATWVFFFLNLSLFPSECSSGTPCVLWKIRFAVAPLTVRSCCLLSCSCKSPVSFSRKKLSLLCWIMCAIHSKPVPMHFTSLRLSCYQSHFLKVVHLFHKTLPLSRHGYTQIVVFACLAFCSQWVCCSAFLSWQRVFFPLNIFFVRF